MSERSVSRKKDQKRWYTIHAPEQFGREELGTTPADEPDQVLGRTITYESANPVAYFIRERRKGTKTAYIVVKMMLHMLPRFTEPPRVSSAVKEILGKEPRSFADFVERNKSSLERVG